MMKKYVAALVAGATVPAAVSQYPPRTNTKHANPINHQPCTGE